DNGINLTNSGFLTIDFYSRFYMDPGNSARLYRVTDQIWESVDYGATWTAINTLPSPTQGPVTAINQPVGTSVSSANIFGGWTTKDTVTALGISTSHDIVWAATTPYYPAPFSTSDAGFNLFWEHPRLFISYGRQQVATNNPNLITKADWYDITPALVNAQLPADTNGNPFSTITNITVDPQNPLVAYVFYNSLTGGGQIYRVVVDPTSTAGGGGGGGGGGGFFFPGMRYTSTPGPGGVIFYGSMQATATDMTGDLPQIPINAAVLDPRQFGQPDDILFIGTGAGVYATKNFQPTQTFFNWTKYGTGLPNANITDLQLSKNLNILAAATYGRGVWEILENSVPTLTKVNLLTGAFEDQPYNITYNSLLAASDASDINGDVPAFQLDTITNGTLLKRLTNG
ncbi:MAG TPA: hypothetical protein VNM37_19225, partial [Candidatus Dormibacteraeota bacterium]|nr:hypothetical protein [Candidatus Dormibacteraeota bacterium]